MGFELTVVNNTPLIGEKDPRIVARTLFAQIGYLTPRAADSNVAFGLVYDCFLLHPDRVWLVEELAGHLKTSGPTVYRHLNRLRGLELLEEVELADRDAEDGKPKKRGPKKRGYRLRYGNLARAWQFVEAHLKVAAENYARTVEHLQDLLDTDPRRTRA